MDTFSQINLMDGWMDSYTGMMRTAHTTLFKLLKGNFEVLRSTDTTRCIHVSAIWRR